MVIGSHLTRRASPPAFTIFLEKLNLLQGEVIDMYESEIERQNREFNELIRHDEKVSDSVKLDDPIRGFTITRGDIKKFYGKSILNRMLEEIRESYNETISDELFNIMFDICKDRGVALKPSVTKKSINNKNSNDTKEGRYKFVYEDEELFTKLQATPTPTLMGGNNFFMKLERGIFRNPEFRKIFKSMFSVYGWLWSNIVRKGWKDTEGYPLKKDYYDNGFLVYSASLSKIAKDCFLDKDTVKTYLDTMRDKGIINIEHITPVGKLRGQGVYILGTWQKIGEKIQERFYINEVFLP